MADKRIGSIGNYYGNLFVKSEGGRFYWGIPDWNGTYWQEIPEYLYAALMRFDAEDVLSREEVASEGLQKLADRFKGRR